MESFPLFRIFFPRNMPRTSSLWPLPVHVDKSRIQGKGLFSDSFIHRRQKIGELTGELISLKEARRRAKRQARIVIVEFENGGAIDGTRGGNHFRFINHSCSPNTFMRRIGQRVEFYALTMIKPGEELTCDYGDSHHDGARRCQCGSPSCRGFL